MKKILVAALGVVLCSPAFAAIQNVKVSGDITSTYVHRTNFDLGLTQLENVTNLTTASINNADVTVPTCAGSTCGQPVGLKRQNVFITQTRVRIDADLSDNVSTTVGLINERAWNSENGATGSSSTSQAAANTDALDTNVQLYLASVTLRELLYSPLTVTVGRQVFNYGNGLVMGDGGVNNQATGNLQFIAQDLTMRTTYDGVKAILDYKPLTIDMFYFKNNQLVLNGNSESDKSNSDVFGFNTNYQLSDPMNTLLEVYMFSRVNGNNNLTAMNAASTSTAKSDTLFVPGLRASTNPIKGLNLQGEVAWQLGRHEVITTVSGVHNYQEAEKRRAMAAQVMGSYAVPVMEKYKPTVNASWTYVSGDKDPNANYGTVPFKSAKYYTAWDPFNESQGGGTIYNTLFQLSNMNIFSVGASVNPIEDVTAAFTWNGLWASVPYSATNPLLIFQPDGGTTQLAPSTKNKNTGLGNEYDVNITYNYTEDVTFGVSLGWFVPGSVFQGGVNHLTAQQALADVAVKF